MIDVVETNVSWLTLVVAGAAVAFFGVLLGFFLASRLKKPHADRQDAYHLHVDTLKGLLDSAERANQGLKQAMEDLEWVAGTDRLTGAWNRRRFEEAAATEMALVRRRKGPVSLIMFDLDDFKQVNDRFGHTTGDAVLVEVVRIARDQLRASDSLARWGGEEFMVLCPATRMEGALNLAEKIRGAVAERHIPGVGSVTVSLGVAEYASGEHIVTWIQRTDEALYRAKEGGRNRVAAGRSGAVCDEPPTPLVEIVWEEAYASGHPTIDAQHRKLFALANALMGAISSRQPSDEVAMRLRRLMAHTAQHFHDEEAILARAGYPALPAHAAEHHRLLQLAGEFEAEVGSGAVDMTKFVGFLILDLVQGHVLIEDKTFFPHFRTRNPLTHP